MEALLRLLVPFAESQLREHGAFAPFGASMAPDGEVKMIAGDAAPSPDGTIDATKLIGAMRDGLRPQVLRDELLATAICSDVGLDHDGYTDGIRVEMEHRDADPLTCVVPYRRAAGSVEFAEMIGMPGERHNWRHPQVQERPLP